MKMCRIGGTLAAVLTLVMFEARLRPGEMLSLGPWSFLGPTEGGWRSKLGDTVIPSDWYREKQNLERRTTRSVSTEKMSMNGAIVREASATDNHRTSPCST